MTDKLDPSTYGEAFDDWADSILTGVCDLIAGRIAAYDGPMPTAMVHYASISGVITAGGWQTRAMMDLYGMNPEPLIGALEAQFREGMNPTGRRGKGQPS